MTFVCQQAQKKLRIQIYCHRNCLASRRALKGWGFQVAPHTAVNIFEVRNYFPLICVFLVPEVGYRPPLRQTLCIEMFLLLAVR